MTQGDFSFAISIAHNSVQHDRMKHIEIGKHFIKEKLDSRLIYTLYVSIDRHLINILIKGLSNTSSKCIQVRNRKHLFTSSRRSVEECN